MLNSITKYLFMKQLVVLTSLLTMAIFMSCKTNNNFTNEENLQYTKRGNRIVKQSFDTLRSSLQTAISEQGVVSAISFCQVNAYPLTDTYASDSVLIRRTALKYRNPANKPDSTEERILHFFASQKENGIENDSLKTVTEKTANRIINFYKPIILQPMCATCHGDKTNLMNTDLWKTIDSLYPSDMAYGYKPGDIRGMWHIQFITKNKAK